MKKTYINTITTILTVIAISTMSMIFEGCSSEEEDIAPVTDAVTYNADGSFTLHTITNVGLPDNYTTTRLATSYNTDNGLGDKTSWTIGDRSHGPAPEARRR